MDSFTINNTLKVLVLVLFATHFTSSTTTGFNISETNSTSSIGGLIPVESTVYRVFDGYTEGRRRLAPFQLCLACKCCAGGSDPSTCTTMPCCFGIDCQLPNKPFGVCAFVPKTCNCTSCAV
ncbi:hypothetical protein BVC80_9045g50 [Macleaya cordata]|uniref:DUF7866 domain-containing protein n=1 Tax=Macleaya cordata TaxID=56857 RepID=A0A200R363_MACCD|nr:hypothetical protein BVC80_9045g50 [Macleaya cordata]